MINESQHWISRVLLDRFRLDGQPLQAFQVNTGEWVPKSVDRTCAFHGYNQLVAEGVVDNSLEAEFSKVESKLRKTLAALEGASLSPRTELPRPVYENLCRYCAFLKVTSPVSKVGGVLDFILQINHELQARRYSLITELNIAEPVLRSWERAVESGNRVIVEGRNLLQLLYRFKVSRTYLFTYQQFLSTKWVVSKSQVPLPLSDVGLVPLFSEGIQAMHYLLPLGPNLLLQGVFFLDLTRNIEQPVIKCVDFNHDEEQECFDTICASAMEELICSQRIRGIPEAIARARERGVSFNRIVDPPSIASAGLNDVGNGELLYRVLPVDEYRRYIHAHVLPVPQWTAR
jgi:hypothetical protein